MMRCLPTSTSNVLIQCGLGAERCGNPLISCAPAIIGVAQLSAVVPAATALIQPPDHACMLLQRQPRHGCVFEPVRI